MQSSLDFIPIRHPASNFVYRALGIRKPAELFRDTALRCWVVWP